jgi:putative chitinase
MANEALRHHVELHELPRGLTASLLRKAISGVEHPEKWVEPINEACQKYGIALSVRRMAAFLGHSAHETKGLRELVEWTSYKAARACKVFPSAFPTLEDAQRFITDNPDSKNPHGNSPHRANPEAFANRVYAHRNGNGDAKSGDGWRYRGRGLLHLTGKTNYMAFAKDSGLDVVAKPDLLIQPRYAALSGAWFWHHHHLNELADKESYRELSHVINRSADGFAARDARRQHALRALCQEVLSDLAVAFAIAQFHGI